MKTLLCRLGLHSPCKTEYIEVTRRRSDRPGGKYHTNYICCRRCGKLCYRMRRRRERINRRIKAKISSTSPSTTHVIPFQPAKSCPGAKL